MATPEQALGVYRKRLSRVSSRIQWFDQQVMNGLRIKMSFRLDTTAQLIRDKVVANIALPVEKDGDGRVTRRSIRGEFPRAETTRLMKDVFWDKSSRLTRNIGTSLDYGLYLEASLDRSFLRRTLNEEQDFIKRMMLRRVN